MFRDIRRAVGFVAVVLMLLLAGLGAGSAAAPPADPALQAAREKLDASRAQLAAVDAALAVEGLRSSDLDDLRTRLDPIRKEVSARLDELTPRLADAKTRLAAFGAKPAEGQPAEDASVTTDRDALQAQVADLDAALKQGRSLLVHADQIADRISARRRAIFAGQLFERSISVMDPILWTAAFTAMPGELRSLQFLVTDWAAFAAQRQSPLVLVGVLLGALGVVVLVALGGSILRRRLRTPPPVPGAELSRLEATYESLKVVILDALVAPVAVAATLAFLSGFDVIPARADDIVHGLVVAVVIQSLGLAMARGLLAPGEGWRRVPRISDRTASLAYRHLAGATWSLSVAAFLNALHRALFAPVSLTVVTSALMAIFVGGFSARLLVHLARAGDAAEEQEEKAAAGVPGTEAPAERPWSPDRVRFLLWIIVVALAGALVAGYISFAAFLAARLVIAAVILGGLYLIYVFIDSFGGEGLAPGKPLARRLSSILGLSQSGLELVAALVSGVLKVVLFFVAAILVVGSLGTSTADVMDTVERITFGVQVGGTTITLWTVISAVALLLVGLAIARGLQRWLTSAVLPRTGLEPSLQSSIATIVGYIGVILAIMVAMGELGLNLENIALVAGALSVGIGFGLQSIVSNFVSGLILLAERPIRVGDTINVKGEEGYVRRISVRSTEIETFDRASVIVPNSDLITGMVKNWTHANTTGRVIVTVTVAYDCDPEEVRDILVSCACDHPQVQQTPPARVFLSKFTESGIVFELRCVVANVDYALTVKSDLHFALLARFRKAGIGLASQPWAALARAPADLVPLPPAPGNRGNA